MAVAPLVRYMLPCDDWRWEDEAGHRVTIVGLVSTIHSLDDPPYPLRYEELCVFLMLTNGRGQAEGNIVCVFEETGRRVFETRLRTIAFGSDPLEIVGVTFRIRDCIFPQPGLYMLQFWYDGSMVEERPLQLR